MVKFGNVSLYYYLMTFYKHQLNKKSEVSYDQESFFSMLIAFAIWVKNNLYFLFFKIIIIFLSFSNYNQFLHYFHFLIVLSLFLISINLKV